MPEAISNEKNATLNYSQNKYFFRQAAGYQRHVIFLIFYNSTILFVPHYLGNRNYQVLNLTEKDWNGLCGNNSL